MGGGRDDKPLFLNNRLLFVWFFLLFYFRNFNGGASPAPYQKASLEEGICLFDLFAEKTVVFDENALQRHLPLEPGKTAEMSILVLGSQAWKLHPATDKIRAYMIFSYSGDDVEKIEYTRDISMVVDVKVMPSLQLSNFDIYELER